MGSHDGVANLPHLFPEVRIGNTSPDVDAVQRIRSCYEFLHRSFGVAVNDSTLANAAGLPLLIVPKQSEWEASLSQPLIRRLRNSAALLQKRLDTLLPPAGGGVATEYVSCLESDQETFVRGTVVFVREVESGTEQYIFPHVQVSLATGDDSVVGFAAPTHKLSDSVGIHAMAATGESPDGPRKAFGFLLSVTPFLPPPWGAAATGLLGVLNLILDSGDRDQITSVTQQLESVVLAEDLRTRGRDPVVGQWKFIHDNTAALGVPIDKVKHPGKVKPLLDNFEYGVGAGWKTVFDANNFLWGAFSDSDYSDYSTPLDLLTNSVGLMLLMNTDEITLGALQASIYLNQGDLHAYKKSMSRWTSRVATIEQSFGAVPPAPWTKDTIDAALAGSQWIPMVLAHMEQIVQGRLSKIPTSTTRWTKENSPSANGWTWKDTALDDMLPEFPEAGDPLKPDLTDPRSTDVFGHPEMIDQERLHIRFDTPGATTCDDFVQHQDLANADLNTYRAKIESDLRTTLHPAVTVVESWATLVAALKELLPPHQPKSLITVVAAPGGPGTPIEPDWVSGVAVKYAAIAVNNKSSENTGPSNVGEWSAEHVIGATAYCRLSKLPVVAGADSLMVYRIARPADGQWQQNEDAVQVGIIQAPFPDHWDDIFTTPVDPFGG